MNHRKQKQKQNQKKKEERQKLIEPIKVFQKIEEEFSKEG